MAKVQPDDIVPLLPNEKEEGDDTKHLSESLKMTFNRSFYRKRSRVASKNSKIQYDAKSYSLNFDDDENDDRNFAAVPAGLAPIKSESTSDVGPGKDVVVCEKKPAAVFACTNQKTDKRKSAHLPRRGHVKRGIFKAIFKEMADVFRS